MGYNLYDLCHGVKVSEIGEQTISGDLVSKWVFCTYGFVPQLSQI